MRCMRGAVRVDDGTDIRILPGIAQWDADRPDVMRGEETQLLGVLDPGFSGLVCIPGTALAWVQAHGVRRLVGQVVTKNENNT